MQTSGIKHSIRGRLAMRAASKMPGSRNTFWMRAGIANRSMDGNNNQKKKDEQENPMGMPPEVANNQVLRDAWERAFARNHIPFQQRPKTAGVFDGALRGFVNLLKAGTKPPPGAAARVAQLAGKYGKGVGNNWLNLFRQNENTFHFVSPDNLFGRGIMGLARAGTGAGVGMSLDQDDPLRGAAIGASAFALGPKSLRMLARGARPFSSKPATESLSHLLTNRSVTGRMFNEPIMRMGVSTGVGEIADQTAALAGFDTEHKGRRLGMALGLGSGLHPAYKALSGRYGAVNSAGRVLSKIIPQGLQKAYKSPDVSFASLALGSPYVTPKSFIGLTGLMSAQGLNEAFLKPRMQNMADTANVLNQFRDSEEFKGMGNSIKREMEAKGIPFYDSTGTMPSAEAWRVMANRLQKGIKGARGVSNVLFGDKDYLMKGENWNRLKNPLLGAQDVYFGQLARLFPKPSEPIYWND